MLLRNHLDRIQITFDDHRLVALHLGLPQLVDRHWTWATRWTEPILAIK